MTLLPGQRLVNGVSNFLFGSNIGQDVASNTVRNTPAIQARIKAGGFQILRFNIPVNKSNSFIDKTIAAIQACGCQFYGQLDGTNLSWNESVISYLGTNCKIWEVGNEPNGANGGFLTGSQYYTQWWSSQVPTLRSFAQAGSFFIGPTITYRAGALDGQFFTDWLTACVNSGNPAMIPDAVSFHHYPCTPFPNKANAPDGTIFASDCTIVNNAVAGVLGHTLPICISEWNVGGGSPPWPYCLDPTFATPWIHQAIDTFVSSGVAVAMTFEAGTGEGSGGLDLITTTAPYPPGPDYQPIVDKYLQYLGSGARHAQFMCHA